QDRRVPPRTAHESPRHPRHRRPRPLRHSTRHDRALTRGVAIELTREIPGADWGSSPIGLPGFTRLSRGPPHSRLRMMAARSLVAAPVGHSQVDTVDRADAHPRVGRSPPSRPTLAADPSSTGNTYHARGGKRAP